MHTKEELTKKRSKSSEQLDLAQGALSSADKVKHKRRWLYFALIITAGLSLVFWAYRSFGKINFSGIKLNLTLPASDNLSFSPQLSALLSQHPQIVGLYLSHDHPSSHLSYGSVSGLDLNALESSLSAQPAIIKSPNSALLPEGLVYHELSTVSDNHIIFSSLITNPIDRIYIIVNFQGSSDSWKSLASELVSAAYWSVSSN
jgi:hypothetical protein